MRFKNANDHVKEIKSAEEMGNIVGLTYEKVCKKLGVQKEDLLGSQLHPHGVGSHPGTFNMHAKFPKSFKFSETGGLTIGNFTTLIDGVQREIGGSEDETFPLTEFFPNKYVSASTVAVDMVNPITGLMNQRNPTAPLVQVTKLGNRTITATPAYYGEEIIINEQDLLFLRDLGNPNVGVYDIGYRIGMWTYQLQIRAQNVRKVTLANAIIDGQFTWQQQTASYGIPSDNRFVPIGADWATGTPLVTNPAAYPLGDIQYTILSDPFFRKYQNFPIKVIMNYKTHLWFFQNLNNNNTIQYIYANSAIMDKMSSGYTMGTAFSYYMGGCGTNFEVVVDGQTYLADAYDPNGNSEGDVVYIIPDGYIYFMVDTKAYGGPLGSYLFTHAVQNGGYMNPQPGPYLLIEDNTAPGTRGGPSKPFLAIISGFNGIPNLTRSQDILTMDVIPGSR